MGYFEGRMTKDLSDEKVKIIKLSNGKRRLGTANELVNAIDAVEENQYFNGSVIELTGGINL